MRDIAALAAEWPSVIDDDGRRARWDPPLITAQPPVGAGAGRRSRWEEDDADEDEPRTGRDGHTGKGTRRMRWILVILLLVGAALAGTFAIAQQSQKPGETVASVAKPADQEAIVERKVIGDWVYGCLNQDKPAPKQCFIRQQLADDKTKSPVITWTLGRSPNGDIVAVWQTPTGVLVGAGVLLDIGGEKPIPVPYRACMPGQCQAVANLEDAFVARLGKAEKARATIVAANGKGLSFDFSVKGLADGIAALKN
jgi:invasion protein IalB